MTRLLAAFSLFVAVAFPGAMPASAEDAPSVYRGHALAMHGEPKYAAGFEHFDYVNPEAPKGGTVRLAAVGSFDNLNPFIIKGTPAVLAGSLTYGTLMRHAEDEPFTLYPYIARSVEMPADRSWIIFTLDPRARFSDGRPVTPEDVIFSLNVLRESAEARPFYRYFFRDVSGIERLGDNRVKFVFSGATNRELPLIIAGNLPILPRHYWEERDFNAVTLEPPVSSGPYTIAEVDPGRTITYRRIEDYWARDLPSMVGYFNYDTIHYQYFRDATVAREALKAGEFDYRQENQAKAWALDYNVPAVREGRLIRRAFPHRRPQGMQAFVYNTRREIFQDPRVRRALAYAFNFEWTNRALFFGQYERTKSYFSNSELAATGLPEGEELAILEQFRGRVAEEVFTTPYTLPSYDGPRDFRGGLRRAFALLEDAGWVVRDMKLVNRETGEQMAFEILLVSPEFLRIVLPFVHNLGRLGIAARVRLVETSQYIERLRQYDFDMIVNVWGQTDSPGNEQRIFWTSSVADVPGAQNYAGVRDPVVDRLVEMVIAAPSRESLVARVRALDRVLLWGHYVIPQWHLSVDRRVYWDKFGLPPGTESRGNPFFTWWVDREKAAGLAGQLRSVQQEQGASATDREGE